MFTPSEPVWSEWEVVQEAKRCLYCGLPGCQKSCPTSLNMKELLHSASVRSWYHGGKIIYSANPLGLATSFLCECKDGTCQSGCNLAKTNRGPINTNEVQKFVATRFLNFGLTVARNPKVEEIKEPVAIIGAGPGGISAATYLARAGFTDITMFDKKPYIGGILMSQISEHRLPTELERAELGMLSDYGVKFNLGKEIDSNTFNEIRKKYHYIVLAVGRSQANLPRFTIPKNLESRVQTSQQFLEQLCNEVKRGAERKLDLKGKNVIVCGAGNTAFDCCECAYRLGAATVRLVMRREMKDVRGHSAGIDSLRKIGVEFTTLREPAKLTETGLIADVMRPVAGKPGMVEKTNNQEEIPGDFVITCFGASVPKDSFLTPLLEHEKGSYECSNVKDGNHIYLVGDFAGSVSVVEAVNDGRCVAAEIYKAVSGKEYCPSLAEIWTEVDAEDISIDVAGMHFPNPFMISSAPISLTYRHLRNCYLAGFGGCVTKTIVLTKDIHVENSLRIFKINQDDRANNTYYNNCMISDHPHEYWLEAIKKLKQEFPDRVLIASIMCSDSKEDWQLLSKLVEKAGADAIEMNLSCPNQCAAEGDAEEAFSNAEKAMAMALGQDLKAVERTTRYVTEVVHIPVFPKLTPNTIQGNIEDYAMAAVRGGATGVSYSNTISVIPKIQLDGSGYPLIGAEGTFRMNIPSGGYSGTSIRPIVLNGVARIWRKYVEEGLEKDHYILGIGGIDSSDAAMQFIYAGASALQVCSACQTYSYEIVQEMKSGMQFILYANRHIDRPGLAEFIHGYGDRSVFPDHEGKAPESNDIAPKRAPKTTTGHELKGQLATKRGIANKYLESRAKMQHTPEWMCKAVINEETCLRCGTCMTSCRDNANNAIEVDDKGVVRVNSNFCIGCGLCSTVCPVQAIRMMEVSNPAERFMNYRKMDDNE